MTSLSINEISGAVVSFDNEVGVKEDASQCHHEILTRQNGDTTAESIID